MREEPKSITEYVDEVMRYPSGRREQALKSVPDHLRDRVGKWVAVMKTKRNAMPYDLFGVDRRGCGRKKNARQT